ncbi:hypothetical protein JTB14_001306 [Gonioctena quinquepunctata]|nr:hypothetical protein JTB14_001306 [Gonioctena quinquepunctata]
MGIHFGFIAKSYDKKYFLLILIGALPIYYLYTNQLVGLQQTTVRIEEVDTPVFNKLNHSKDSSTLLNTAVLENINYFINTSKCRIPRSDPFSEDIIEYLVYEKYEPCTTLGLLSYIDKSDGIVSLRINSSLLHQYSSIEVTCCYSNITRINYIDDVDNEIEFTPMYSIPQLR